MNQTAIGRGRQHGSKNKNTLIKARHDEAYGLLEGIMRDRNANPELRIQAASAIIGAHYQRPN